MFFKTLKQNKKWVKLSNLGLSNDLFQVSETLFVKRSTELSSVFLNKQSQTKIIKLIKKQQFTLKIKKVKIINNKLLVVMPFYHNLENLSRTNISYITISNCATLVKSLHKVKINKKIPKWDPIIQLNTYCQLITLPKILLDLKADLIKWLDSYQPEKLVLCHNDLSNGNFVKSGKSWYLIDWDFAAVNDVLFDVASFISETLINENNIYHWLNCFDINNKQLIIIKKWINYQNLIWFCWAKYLFNKTKDQRYQNIAKEKANKLSQRVNLPLIKNS